MSPFGPRKKTAKQAAQALAWNAAYQKHQAAMLGQAAQNRRKASKQQAQMWAQTYGSLLLDKARADRPLDAAEPELVAEPLLGYRVWALNDEPLVLSRPLLRELAAAHERGENPFAKLAAPQLRAAAGGGYGWERDNTAVCSQGDGHPVPDPYCGCGFWAFKDPNRAADLIGSYPGAFVLGQVALWGRVIEHQLGYRGQYARVLGPLRLFGSPIADEEILQLAQRYQCGVYAERVTEPLPSPGHSHAIPGPSALIPSGPSVTFPANAWVQSGAAPPYWQGYTTTVAITSGSMVAPTTLYKAP